MYALYSFLFGAWVFLMTPFFLYKAWRHKKYLPSLKQRLGSLPETLKSDGRPTIWFHSCSVGETLSIQALVHQLHQQYPEARLVFSTITKGGQAIAEERYSKYGPGNTFYFPIDLGFIAQRVLDWIQPAMLVTVDTEIWPNVLHEAKKRDIPIVLVNGRISAESFQYYRWVQPFLGRIFENYHLLMMKSKEDADRIQHLGARPSKIQIGGNIKYDKDLVAKEITEAQAQALDDALRLTQTPTPLIVAGSTHEDEEKTLLEVLQRLRQVSGLEQTRLLITPRHAERFDVVAGHAERQGFQVRRRSHPSTGAAEAEVLLLDTFGELSTAYQFATVVFVGGTLIPHGGQSIMEPAVYAKPIVIGPHMENFPGIIDDFVSCSGIRKIIADENDKEAQKKQLTEAFTELLLSPEARQAMGQAAYAIFEGSRGATQFAADRIMAIYNEKVTA